ncbi:MAG: hypothetical protein A4E40_00906 [Methanoregulaceae archaeon PtaU1.Bin059]|nr:MAG: hypothetical protein A4E40_00906 [Methanoregulaceae archaeon PtaU1.Bin059]
MMRFPDRRFLLIPLLLLFIIPLNIYVIGDWIGTGVQWALFRYQDTLYGTSFITPDREVWYLTSGLITGKSAVSISLWVAGAVLLVISCIALAVMIAEEMDEHFRIPGLMVIASSILLLLSCMTQYGPLLSGPAGFSVPVGIPLVWAVGWLIFSQEKLEQQEEHKEEEVLDGRNGE